MAVLKGEDINIGFERETTRGTFETPAIWMPARTPNGLKPMNEKVLIKETKGSGVASQGSEIVQARAEGDVEFNVRNGSLGFLLTSLFGSLATTTLESGVYQHVLNVLTGNAQYPTISAGVANGGMQDYKYTMGLVTSLEIRTPIDDLVNATAQMVFQSESTNSSFTVAFPDDDYYFRHYDVEIKIASDVSGLGAANALTPKEFSLSMNNNGRVDQNIGSVNPADVLGLIMEITGSISFNKVDETYHDLYINNTERAMQITMTRSDITIGTENNPTITFVMPKITFESFEPDRPIDDIVKEALNFQAHHDDTEGYAIRATLVNEVSDYA